MNGAFGFIFKDKSLGQSFFYCIREPDGKFSNLIAFLKFFNLLRVGNCDITNDDLSTLGQFIASLKRIIGNDAEFVARTLQDFGAILADCELTRPKGFEFQRKQPVGNGDGGTLSATDEGVRAFLCIYGVFADGPDKIMSGEIVKSLITVVLMALSAAPYSVFFQAFDMCNEGGYQVPGKAITRPSIGFRLAQQTPTGTLENK